MSVLFWTLRGKVVLALTKQVHVDTVALFFKKNFIHLTNFVFNYRLTKRATILKISSGGGYPRIYRVWWTSQSMRKVLPTCLVKMLIVKYIHVNFYIIIYLIHGFNVSDFFHFNFVLLTSSPVYSNHLINLHDIMYVHVIECLLVKETY